VGSLLGGEPSSAVNALDSSTMSSPIIPLARAFASRYHAPVITHVDTAIFQYRYFTHCLACSFCHDQCCEHGVDVDLYHVAAIERYAEQIESYTGIPRARWLTKRIEVDTEQPGGGALRTRVRGGACVFLRRQERGCLIHAFALDRGIDYHEIKSVVDCLFPITFADGTLCPADEVADGTLICVDEGPTLYRGLRGELAYYFGDDFVAVLDDLEGRIGESTTR
jgi:hypothetical protein